MTARLPITMACWDYDRMRALRDGRVAIEGVDLTYLSLFMPESFFRMQRHGEFHVSEMSLGWYTRSVDAEPRPFQAVPVFPSRMFRHSGIYINAQSGIEAPADLRGKRVVSVGTGASAIQYVPSIQPEVEQLHVFQRTAPWIFPHSNRPITEIKSSSPWSASPTSPPSPSHPFRFGAMLCALARCFGSHPSSPWSCCCSYPSARRYGNTHRNSHTYNFPGDGFLYWPRSSHFLSREASRTGCAHHG